MNQSDDDRTRYESEVPADDADQTRDVPVFSPDAVPTSQDDAFDQTLDRLPADTDQTLDSVAGEQGGDQDQTFDSLPSGNDLTRVGGSSESPSSFDDIDFSLRQDPEQCRETARYDGDVKRIGRYQIRRVLGEGAFGCVYEANDPQLDRIVAVKVAKSLNTANEVERFLREARSAAQLRHPRIVPVHEYGQVDGQHIIVYEFIEGETLKSYIERNKPLELSDALRLIRLIAEGLDYAHSKGIIHRDMKPDNVMIDSQCQPHIADFGCARSMDADVSLTMDGSIMGTPTYMSPEQAGGRSNVADGRTDIWSLGVMLYEMVAGEKPFSGKLTDLLFWIRNHDPTPLRKLNPAAPIDVETICSKCLQRDLSDRFPDAQTLADEIERFERGEPIESRPVSVFRRTVLWSKRNPAVANLLGLVALTLLLGITFSSWFAIDARKKQLALTKSNVKLLTTATPSQLPVVYESLARSKASGSVLPQLKQRLAAGDESSHDAFRLRTAILNLDSDPDSKAGITQQLIPALLNADANEFMVGRDSIMDRGGATAAELWPISLDQNGTRAPGERFRAACLLTRLDPESENWPDAADDVSQYLISRNLIELSGWLPFVLPVRDQLKPGLVQAYESSQSRDDSNRDRVTAIVVNLFKDQPDFLISLIDSATPSQLAMLCESLQEQSETARQLLETRLSQMSEGVTGREAIIAKANLIIAAIRVGDQQQWGQLRSRLDASVATEIIQRLAPAATPLPLLEQELVRQNSGDPEVLAGLVLSLGQFTNLQIPDSKRRSLKPQLLDMFSNHPDAQVHSAARWLLQRWGFTESIASAEAILRRAEPVPGKRWHVDLGGNTFAIFSPVDQFSMGSTSQQLELIRKAAGEVLDEPLHRRSIPRRFGICIHEVTVEQYERFENARIVGWEKQVAKLSDPDSAEAKKLNSKIANVKRSQVRRGSGSTRVPVVEVDFYRALQFCRWTSEEYRVGPCLPKLATLEKLYDAYGDEAFSYGQKHLKRAGYRLPTSGEWEYACRAGTLGLRPLGELPERLGAYAWHQNGQVFELQETGQLRPNPAGLFDILGNASEWCMNWYRAELPPVPEGEPDFLWTDFGGPLERWSSASRECRGGSFRDPPHDVRSAKRFPMFQFKGLEYLGFRMARTYPD